MIPPGDRHRPWAIVLGARLRPDGLPSTHLEDRLLTGRDLIRESRVDRLLLSGAEYTPWGDEVAAMAAWCLRAGVAASRLVCDPAGTRTRTSLIRAATLFGVRSAFLCTQRFHLPRSLFWARACGMDAEGAPADRRTYHRARLHHLREVAAWVVAATERTVLPIP